MLPSLGRLRLGFIREALILTAAASAYLVFPGSMATQHSSACFLAWKVPCPYLLLFRQQGNPVLKHIRNVRWVYGDIGPDYQLGPNTVALYLSLR